MSMDRERIDKTFEALRRATNAGDWNAFADCFAEDGTFINSALKEPIKGRESIRAFAAHWPRVVNRPEWVVVEGNRLVLGWNERQAGTAEGAPTYRGISTFVFNADGLVLEYEGMFDTAAVAAATGASRTSSP